MLELAEASFLDDTGTGPAFPKNENDRVRVPESDSTPDNQRPDIRTTHRSQPDPRVEPTFFQCRQPSLSTSILKPPVIRGAAPSLVELQTGQGAPAAPQGQACWPSQGLSGWTSQTHPQSSQSEHFIIETRP